MVDKNSSKKRQAGRDAPVAKNPHKLAIGQIQNTRRSILQRIFDKIPVVRRNNITLMIHPTIFGDYDVIAIGSFKLLRQLALKKKHFDLIKRSKFGGIPILIIASCRTLKCAMNCLKECKKLYE